MYVAAGLPALEESEHVYGVPSDLDLTPFLGARLINVCLGLANTLFVFEMSALDYAKVNVEGRWEAVDPDGRVLGGRSRPEGNHRLEATLALTDLLGRLVEASALDPPRSFELRLSGGVGLRFYDDSDEFESMTIEPGAYVI
jgi:hypothetical protein